MRARIFSAILLGLSALLAAAPIGTAQAQYYGPPPGYGGPRDGVQPLDRLLPGIRRAHPGDFYDAEGPTYGPQGDPHYHLKWMTPDGRIVWYDTDARTGRVLGSSPGRDTFDAPNRMPQAAPQTERMPDRFFPGAGRDYGNGPAGQMERGDRNERGRNAGNSGRNFDGRFRQR